MYSHATVLLWHLGVERAIFTTSAHLLVTVKLLDAIDLGMKFSDDENNPDIENQLFLAFAIATNKTDTSDEDSAS